MCCIIATKIFVQIYTNITINNNTSTEETVHEIKKIKNVSFQKKQDPGLADCALKNKIIIKAALQYIYNY